MKIQLKLKFSMECNSPFLINAHTKDVAHLSTLRLAATARQVPHRRRCGPQSTPFWGNDGNAGGGSNLFWRRSEQHPPRPLATSLAALLRGGRRPLLHFPPPPAGLTLLHSPPLLVPRLIVVWAGRALLHSPPPSVPWLIFIWAGDMKRPPLSPPLRGG